MNQPMTPEERAELILYSGIMHAFLACPLDSVNEKCAVAANRFIDLDLELSGGSASHPAQDKLNGLLDGIDSPVITLHTLVKQGVALIDLYLRERGNPACKAERLQHIRDLIESSVCRTLAHAVIHANVNSTAGFPNVPLILSMLSAFAKEADSPEARVCYALAAFYEARRLGGKAGIPTDPEALKLAGSAAGFLTDSKTLERFMKRLSEIERPVKRKAILSVAAPMLEISVDARVR